MHSQVSTSTTHSSAILQNEHSPYPLLDPSVSVDFNWSTSASLQRARKYKSTVDGIASDARAFVYLFSRVSQNVEKEEDVPPKLVKEFDHVLSALLCINKYAAGCSNGRVSDVGLRLDAEILDGHRYNLKVSLTKFGYKNMNLWDLNKVIAMENWDILKGLTSPSVIPAYKTSATNKNVLKVYDINRGRDPAMNDYFVQVNTTDGANLAWASGVKFRSNNVNMVRRSS